MPRKPLFPLAAGLPGVIGVLPLFAAAALYAWGKPDQAGVALLTLFAYSAVSLTFAGAARWGFEASRETPRLSVMAAASLAPVAAWLMLVTPIPEPKWQLGGFIALFLAQWLWDTSSKSLPAWWSPFRTAMTLGAGLALAVGLETAMKL